MENISTLRKYLNVMPLKLISTAGRYNFHQKQPLQILGPSQICFLSDLLADIF